MATSPYSSVLSHTTDAEFRAWASELDTNMRAAGLVQTADTGQINFATVLRPAANTAGGYCIYRFNDSLQATYPIYLKVEFGTATSAAVPQIWLTAGTGSNGSGTLTGQASTRSTCASNTAPASTVTAYNTYVCVKNGHLAVLWKAASQATSPFSQGYFQVSRTTDDAGAETGDGYTVFSRQPGTTTSGAVVAQPVSVANATTFAVSSGYGLVHMGVSSSLVGTDKQVYKCYTIQPRVRPILQACIVVASEYALSVTLTTTLVGASSRTYLSGGTSLAYAGANGSALYNLAFLYE